MNPQNLPVFERAVSFLTPEEEDLRGMNVSFSPTGFLALFDFVLRSSSRNDLFFRNGITLSIRPGEILVGSGARNIGKYIFVVFA